MIRIDVPPTMPSDRTPEQALGVDAALLLFDPDGGFVFIRLLNKERSGTRVQANLVLNSDFFDKHFNTPLLP